jgi:hypothetical protein
VRELTGDAVLFQIRNVAAGVMDIPLFKVGAEQSCHEAVAARRMGNMQPWQQQAQSSKHSALAQKQVPAWQTPPDFVCS